MIYSAWQFDQTRSATADELFPWWSFTKTLIAICAVRLAEDGVLSLDTQIPEYTFNLQHLLQHRSGLPDYGALQSYQKAVANGEKPWSRDRLFDETDGFHARCASGTGWAYSNIGYLLAVEWIEEQSGCTLGDLLKQYISDPLGLQGMTLAKGPQGFSNVKWPAARKYDPGWVYHGCVVGTAQDAVTCLHSLMTGLLVTPTALQIMKDRFPIGGPLAERPWLTTGYGLGLMSGRVQTLGRAVGHSGGGPFCVNAVYHFPDAAIPITVGCFAQGADEGVAELAAVECAMQHLAAR